jgi:hypothetical protein
MPGSSWADALHVAVARNVTTHNPNRVTFIVSSCRGAAIKVHTILANVLFADLQELVAAFRHRARYLTGDRSRVSPRA